MSEFYGGDYIYSIISSNTDITDIVGDSIYNARLVPSTDTSMETINFYRTSATDNSLNYLQAEWSIDCRSSSQTTAFNIALAVVDSLNRVYNTTGGQEYFGVTSLLPTIPPITDQDVFNVPVQLLVRR